MSTDPFVLFAVNSFGGGHGAAFGVEQRLASGLNHERAGEGVGAAELEILVVDGVHDRHLPARLGGLIAVGGVSRLRLDLRPLLVVERHPDGLGHPRVALDPEGLGDELVALIGLAGSSSKVYWPYGSAAEGVIGRADEPSSPSPNQMPASGSIMSEAMASASSRWSLALVLWVCLFQPASVEAWPLGRSPARGSRRSRRW